MILEGQAVDSSPLSNSMADPETQPQHKHATAEMLLVTQMKAAAELEKPSNSTKLSKTPCRF